MEFHVLSSFAWNFNGLRVLADGFCRTLMVCQVNVVGRMKFVGLTLSVVCQTTKQKSLDEFTF